MYIFKITLPESLLRQKRDISFLMIRNKAYDMFPVNVIMPEDKEQMALTINGKNVIFIKRNFENWRSLTKFHQKLRKIC